MERVAQYRELERSRVTLMMDPDVPIQWVDAASQDGRLPMTMVDLKALGIKAPSRLAQRTGATPKALRRSQGMMDKARSAVQTFVSQIARADYEEQTEVPSRGRIVSMQRIRAQAPAGSISSSTLHGDGSGRTSSARLSPRPEPRARVSRARIARSGLSGTEATEHITGIRRGVAGDE